MCEFSDRLLGIAFNQAVSMKVFIDRVKAQLPPESVLDVTGHSLGGHLTTILMGMEPDLINHIYTWNGAGVLDTPAGDLTQAFVDLYTKPENGEYSKAAQYIIDNYESFISNLKSKNIQNRITNYVIGLDVVSEIGTNYSLRAEFSDDIAQGHQYPDVWKSDLVGTNEIITNDLNEGITLAVFGDYGDTVYHGGNNDDIVWGDDYYDGGTYDDNLYGGDGEDRLLHPQGRG